MNKGKSHHFCSKVFDKNIPNKNIIKHPPCIFRVLYLDNGNWVKIFSRDMEETNLGNTKILV